MTLAVVISLGAQPATSVQASATLGSYGLTCSSLRISGTTTASYLGVFLHNDTTNELIYNVGDVIYPAAGGSFSFTVNFPAQSKGDLLWFDVWGNTTATGFNWDSENYITIIENCTSAVPGPSHPAGFMQRNITCDTPVYGEPGGNAIPDTLILAGQAWHIDPTPVTGADGQMWHEVFVGSYENGFIPAGCVGALTEFN